MNFTTQPSTTVSATTHDRFRPYYDSSGRHGRKKPLFLVRFQKRFLATMSTWWVLIYYLLLVAQSIWIFLMSAVVKFGYFLTTNIITKKKLKQQSIFRTPFPDVGDWPDTISELNFDCNRVGDDANDDVIRNCDAHSDIMPSSCNQTKHHANVTENSSNCSQRKHSRSLFWLFCRQFIK